jgi:hypothetical protein
MLIGAKMLQTNEIEPGGRGTSLGIQRSAGRPLAGRPTGRTNVTGGRWSIVSSRWISNGTLLIG